MHKCIFPVCCRNKNGTDPSQNRIFTSFLKRPKKSKVSVNIYFIFCCTIKNVPPDGNICFSFYEIRQNLYKYFHEQEMYKTEFMGENPTLRTGKSSFQTIFLHIYIFLVLCIRHIFLLLCHQYFMYLYIFILFCTIFYNSIIYYVYFLYIL